VYVAIFIASIAFVIMFHEFGHFATAKAFGMKAEKFFLGFGPTIWSFRRGETEYGVKAIPAGGFVKIAGMSRFEEVDEADRGRLFYEQPAWQRVIVLVAGSATHFVVAFALLFAALALYSVQTATNGVAEVVPDTAAAGAGIRPGDQIVAVDGVETADFEQVRDEIAVRPGETVALEILRDGTPTTIEVAVGSRDEPDGTSVGFLGVSPTYAERTFSVGEAFRGALVGDYSVARLTTGTLGALADAFSPEVLGDFFGSVTSSEPRDIATTRGPSSLVGAGQAVNAFGQSGNTSAVLVLLASLNIVLGTLNMLPLPPLDGGHVATLAIEETVNARRRSKGVRERWHLDPAIVTPVALAVILFFGVISLTAIYVDIVNPLTGIQ